MRFIYLKIYLLVLVLTFVLAPNTLRANITNDTVQNVAKFYSLSASTLFDKLEGDMYMIGEFYSPLVTSTTKSSKMIFDTVTYSANSILDTVVSMGKSAHRTQDEVITKTGESVADVSIAFKNIFNTTKSSIADSRNTKSKELANTFSFVPNLNQKKINDFNFVKSVNGLINEATVALGAAGYEGANNVLNIANGVGGFFTKSHEAVIGITGEVVATTFSDINKISHSTIASAKESANSILSKSTSGAVAAISIPYKIGAGVLDSYDAVINLTGTDLASGVMAIQDVYLTSVANAKNKISPVVLGGVNILNTGASIPGLVGQGVLDSYSSVIDITGDSIATASIETSTRSKKILAKIHNIVSTNLEMDTSDLAGVGSIWSSFIDRLSTPLVPLFEQPTVANTPSTTKPKQPVVLSNTNSNTEYSSNPLSLRTTPSINVIERIIERPYAIDFNTPLSNLRQELLTLNASSVSYLKDLMSRQEYKTAKNVTNSINNITTGGSGTLTSVDASGGTTGLTFSGGPITTSGTLTLGGTLAISNGGTGITTAPSYGQVLLGNSSGGYDLVATSSLGITSGTTGVTSIDLSVPTGLSVSGGPITTSGTLALSLTSGYTIPLSASTTEWDAAYSNRITSASAPLSISNNIISLSTAGDWAGTLDGQDGSYYLNASNLTNFGIPFYTYFSATTTDALAEGSNLYYTTSRQNTDFDTRLATKSTSDLVEGSNLYFTSNRVASVIAGTTTDALAQGSTNKYYSSSLFNTDLATKTTSDLIEGSNLYYMDSRVDSYINASTTIPKLYSTNVFTGSNTFNSLTLGSLNGPLQANNGVISATSSIGVLYGGTGLTAAPSYGQMLLGNSLGGYDLVATSSLGITATNYWTLSGTDLYNNSGTNVGIGTSTPTTKFMINGVGTVTTPSSSGTVQAFIGTGGNTNIGLVIRGNSVSQSGPLQEWQANTGTAVATMRVSGTLFLADTGVVANSAAAGYATVNGFTAMLGNGGTGYGAGISSTAFNIGTGNLSSPYFTVVKSSQSVGVGSTTPWGQLSLNPNGITGPAFVVGSSTATNFIIDNAGRVGINTLTNQAAKLTISTTVGGDDALILRDTTSNANARFYFSSPLGTAPDLNIDTASGGGRIFLRGIVKVAQIDALSSTLRLANQATAVTIGSVGTITIKTNGNDTSVFTAGSGANTVVRPYFSGSAYTNLLLAPDGGNIGIASSTPWGRLSVNPNGITGPAFVVGSSTATNFIVTNGGLVGVGNAAPVYKLDVTGTTSATVFRMAESTTNGDGVFFLGTKRFLYGNSTGENAYFGTNAGSFTSPGAGNTAVGNGAMSSVTGGGNYNVAIGDMALPGLSTGSYNIGIGQNVLHDVSTGGSNVAIGFQAGYLGGANNVLIGYQAGKLSAGSNNIIIGYDINTLSNPGSNRLNIGNLIFGTGIDGTGTTLSTGSIGIASSTPWRKLSVVGTMAVNGLSASGATDQNVCINPDTKEITFGTSCIGSSARFKHDIVTLENENGLSLVKDLRPVSFTYNQNNESSLGFIAEEVNLLEPRLVFYEEDGVTPKGVRYENFAPVVVKAIQELSLNLDTIASTTLTVTPESETFANSFFSSIYAHIGMWLDDATNGIKNIFVDKVSTKELCVGETCVTEDQLKSLLQNAGQSPNPNPNPNPNTNTTTTGGSDTGGAGDNNSQTDQIDTGGTSGESVTPDSGGDTPVDNVGGSDPVPDPAPEPEPAPEPTPEPTPDPAPESAPAPTE